jgi:uncharacterized membrane protein
MTKPADRSSGSGVNDTLLLGACCSALATLVPVALYQTGLLKRLPDPPSSIFDSERIASSKAAHPFGVPDALLGLASFGTTLALILLSRENQTAKRLLGPKLVLDAAAGAFNAGRQVVGFGKLCSCCTGTVIAAGAMAYAGRGLIRDTWRSARSAVPHEGAL